MSDPIPYRIYSQSRLNLLLQEKCMDGELDVVKYLLTNPEMLRTPAINSIGGLPLSNACASGNLDLVKFLLSSPLLKTKADVNEFSMSAHRQIKNSPVTACILNNQLNILKYIILSPELEENAKLKPGHNANICETILTNRVEVIAFLVEHFQINELPHVKELLKTQRKKIPSSMLDLFDIIALKNDLNKTLIKKNTARDKINKI